MDISEIVRNAEELRKRLHIIPELSMREVRTRKLLADYLGADCPEDQDYLFIRLKGTAEKAKKIGFRAEMDALPGNNGKPGHYCGHDGHTAILASICSYYHTHPHRNDLYFMFQPGEEIGAGGEHCAAVMAGERIDEVYGFHNIPAQPLNVILLKEGTVACASTGLELEFCGAAAHAAYPEDGKNPADAIARTILFMEEYLLKPHEGMLLGTVIGVSAGSESYGTAASSGILRLTLRGRLQNEFDAFVQTVKEKAQDLAESQGIRLRIREIERFPATENCLGRVRAIEKLCSDNGLPYRYLSEPFRWSDDFGYYPNIAAGLYFGVGDGENYPGLHTAGYTFPDDIMYNTVKLLTLIAES